MSAPPKLAALEDDDEQSKFACRVCWEHEASEANLLSPCKCAGTQKHVHLKCLRRWQENVQKRDAADERAFRCSVCRALFSVPPPKPRGCALAVQALRGIGGALCISLLAFGLSGPPWPHLALLVLLLLASRSHWLPGVALLLVCSLLATMHARGLRVVLRVDGGGRLGLALIRRGAPVAGLRPGVLLVASEGLDHSIFRRSVVLLTQHDRSGARGVILTQPMTTPPTTGSLADSLAWEAAVETAPSSRGGPRGAATARTSSSGGASSGGHGGGAGRRRAGAGRHSGAQEGGVVMKHFLGGPVGMPGEGVNHEVMVLHSVEGVAGARRILPAVSNATRARTRAAAAAGSDHGDSAPAGEGHQDGGPGSAPTSHPQQGPAGPASPLYEGGSVSEILERAAAAASAAAGQAARQRHTKGQGQGQGQGGDPAPAVLLFHGVCAWAEGQLEGELRSGAWGFTASPAPSLLSLLSLPPDQLWQALTDSPHLARVH